MRILGELARAIAAAHHVGIVHGRLNPWAVHVGASDRPRIELTGLATRSDDAPVDRAVPRTGDDRRRRARSGEPTCSRSARCSSLSRRPGAARFPRACARSIADATAADPEARPSATALVRRLVGAGTLVDRAPRGASSRSRDPRDPGSASSSAGSSWRSSSAPARWARSGRRAIRPAVRTSRSSCSSRRSPSNDELLRRFRKEGRVLAKVGSPYIANYVDLNEDKGFHYLVLELVAGGSVAAALRRMRQAARAARARHRRRYVPRARRAAPPRHRPSRHQARQHDVRARRASSSRAQPSGQLVKLGDFGIARLVEQTRPHGREGATREGAVLGTPEFMAPEQCQGAQVTPATDVYALGCCLFALDRRPAAVPAVRTTTQMAVILQHLREPPPRLDTLVPEVSPQVADLVAKCLAKDPKRAPAGRHRGARRDRAAVQRHDRADHRASRAADRARVASCRRTRSSGSCRVSPEALWPFVSNTEKMNRATGLAPVRFEIESTRPRAHVGQHDGQPARRRPQAQVERASVRVDRGQPPRRAARVREGRAALVRRRRSSSSAPRAAARSCATRSGSSRAACSRACCRSGRSASSTSASSTRSTRGSIACSPRARAPRSIRSIPRSSCRRPRRRASPRRRGKLATAGVDDRAAEALGAYLLHASDQDVARIRPIELAHKFGVPEDDDDRRLPARREARRARDGVGRDLSVVPDPVVGRRLAQEDPGARQLQDVQHRLRRRLLARDRARVPRVARHPRRRDAHVLHRRPRALPARRGAGAPAARRAVRAAAVARRRATTWCAARSCRAPTSSASAHRVACAASTSRSASEPTSRR